MTVFSREFVREFEPQFGDHRQDRLSGKRKKNLLDPSVPLRQGAGGALARWLHYLHRLEKKIRRR